MDSHNLRLTILLVNPKNPYHWVQIKCTVEKKLREWEPGGEDVTKQLDRIWHKYNRPIRPLRPARIRRSTKIAAVCVRYRTDRTFGEPSQATSRRLHH